MFGPFLLGVLVSAAVAIGVQGSARAQRIDGAVRLGLELAPFTIETVTGSESSESFEQTQTTTSFGVTPSVLGFNMGFAAGENAVLGTRLSLGVDSREIESDGVSAKGNGTSVMLLPYAEFMFGDPSSSTRGLMGVTGGFIGRSAKADGGSEVSFSGGLIGGTLGARIFVSDDISIDPLLLIAYQAGTSTSTDDFDGFEAKLATHGSLIGALLSFSMWPGAKPAVSDEDHDYVRVRAGPAHVPTGLGVQRSPPAHHSAVNVQIDLPGYRLTVFGNVERWGPKVGFTFAARSREDVFAKCEMISVIVDDQVAELPAKARSQWKGNAYEGELLVTLPFHDVERIAQGETITFDLCGASRTLTVREKVQLQSFLRRTRAYAAEHGVDLAPPAEPVEPTGESMAASEAAAGAATPAEAAAPASAPATLAPKAPAGPEAAKPAAGAKP